MNNLTFVLVTGIGATAVMDFWCLVRKPLFGALLPKYSLLGRWIAYMPQGRLLHDPISTSPPVRGEQLLGWSADYYMIGIVFAALLVGIYGETWIHNPTPGPALTIGMATIVAHFC